MNSTPQAKLHYDGKPHQKKVSMYLNQSVKKIKTEDGQVNSTSATKDSDSYCEVINVFYCLLIFVLNKLLIFSNFRHVQRGSHHKLMQLNIMLEKNMQKRLLQHQNKSTVLIIKVKFKNIK